MNMAVDNVICKIYVGEAIGHINGAVVARKHTSDNKYMVYIVGGFMPDGAEYEPCDTAEEAMEVAFNTARILERDFREGCINEQLQCC